MSESSERIDGGRARRRTGHEEVWDLLPWFVNGTLEQGEARTVEEHLAACGICREEARYWRGFAGVLREEGDLAVSAEAGLARVRGRLTGSGGGARRRVRRRRWLAGLRAAPASVRWALAAQLAAIAVLAALLASFAMDGAPGGYAPAASAAAAPAGPFRTLSDPPAPAAGGETTLLRVVFDDRCREREIRGALIAVGGRIVDGPSPFGTYTVAVDGSGEGEAILETFRSFPPVLFAERAATPGEMP